MRLFPILFLLLLNALPAAAAAKSVTLYLDGARIEQKCTATKRSVEVSLPAAMQDGSLRIKPLEGSSIEQVEFLPAKPDAQLAREKAKLNERRNALRDRLQALDDREAIFKAAAKSQSTKSPRKTKTNPDPLTSVRQGTEFAIAQLEGVYRARRAAEGELHTIEARLTAIKREGNGSAVRVRLSGKGGLIKVSYLRSDLKWTPSYDFRITKAGEVDVVMRAFLPKMEKGAAVAVVPALIGEGADDTPLPVAGDGFTQLAVFTFPVEQQKYVSTPVSSISFSFRNQSSRRLPAGDASCYLHGEYLGKTPFSGFLPGDSRELTCGRQAPPQ